MKSVPHWLTDRHLCVDGWDDGWVGGMLGGMVCCLMEGWVGWEGWVGSGGVVKRFVLLWLDG